MDWVYDQAHGDTSESVQIMEFARDAGLDTNGGFGLLYVCEGAGLVRSTSALGDPCVTLTAAGIADVHARRQRREDPAQRAAAARTGLLRWSYRQHLANKQLIEGAVVEEYAGPVTAEITPAGIECVVDFGGNVPDYLRDQRSQGPSMNVNGPVVYGDVHGAQLAWGNQTVTQNQQQTQQSRPGSRRSRKRWPTRSGSCPPSDSRKRTSRTPRRSPTRCLLRSPGPNQTAGRS